MPFDPDAYLADEKPAFDPDAYLAADTESTFNPSDYLKGENLNVSDSIEVDTNWRSDKPVTEDELESFAGSYGVDKEELRDYVGWRGGIAPLGKDEGVGESIKEGAKQALGKTSEMLGFGAAGFIAKKLKDDPQFSLAAEDIDRLISKKQSYVGDVSQLAGGIKAAMGLGKAAESASKLPAMARKLYEPASAVGGAATHGLFHSTDGNEMQEALTSGMYGMVGYGGFKALGTGAAKLQKLRKGKLPPLSNETNDTFANARKDFEELNQKGEYQDFREGIKSQDGLDALLESGDRTTAYRFMEFVNGKYKDINKDYLVEARKMIAPDDIKPEQLEKVIVEYGESIRAGKVTDDVIDAFLVRDHAIDSLYTRNLAELNKLDIVEPDDLFEASFQKNVLEKVRTGALSAGEDNLLRSTQVFRLIDDRTGTGLEPILNKAYRANAMKVGFERKLLDSVNAAKKLQHKQNVSTEQMYKNIQNPSVKDEATEAWRDAFQNVRELSNDLGLGVRDLGRTYVPQRKKSGANLIKTLEDQADKLGLTSDVAAGDISFKQLLKKRDELLEGEDLGNAARQWIESLNGKSRDMAYLVHELERATQQPIQNVHGIKQAISDLRSEKVINNMAEIQVGALHARDELAPPEWLTEKNLNRLFRRSVSEAGNQIFMDPIARQFSLMGGLLRTRKESRAANYVDDFVSDIMGMARKGKMKDTSLDRIKKDLKIMDSDSTLPEMQEALMDMSVKSFYASVMGARVDNVIRNLTQPLTKAVPEFGWTKGTKYLAKAYKDMAVDIVSGGWKNMVRETEEVYNLKAPVPRAEDFAGIKEDIFRNVDDRKIRIANEVVDSYAQFSMKMYMASDEVNRVATTTMSKEFVKDLLNAKSPGELAKLKQITTRWPRSLQRELDIAMGNPATTAEDLTQLVAGHLVPEAQVMYGTLGRSRIHRSMGQIISTLSDYPHHMLSDAYYKLVTNKVGGMVELIRTYTPSALLFVAADRMLNTDDPRVQETLGKSGTFGYHPLNTLSSASSIFGAPHIENVAKMGYGMINPKHENSRKFAIKNFIQSYGLFPGMAWKHGENGYDLLKAWNNPKKGGSRGRRK